MKGNDKKEYKNWYKALLRIQKKELILFVVLILLAFIFVGISSDICKWLKTEVIYNIVNNKPLINIPICIIISSFAIWWWRKIWKDKDIRPYRLGIVAFGLIVFIFIDGFLYANIVCNFSYQWFFIGLFSLLFIVSLIKIFATCEITWAQNLIDWTFEIFKKLIKCIKIFWENKGKIKDKENNNTTESKGSSVNDTEIKDSKENKEPELKGFSVDNTEIKLEDNQIKYAKTLVKKLKNTDLSKESFAVGITGEWGSGKSTFLNTMKKEIGEDFAEIVEFNPWLCNSPEQVTQDFFATLINELSPKHSTLSRDLNKYAKLLNKIAKSSLSVFGIDLDLTPSDDSLNKLKENISDKLANLPKKVVILIDDTDRLEGNEVFEILRLIRNTADFKNVIYIATYDKEYVTDVLEKNKIKDPSAYLEKIFQVEVHLLKTESFELWDTLMEEIKKQDQTGVYYDKKLIEGYFYVEKKFILQILTNYRKVKRFARQYTLFLYYAKGEIKGLFSELDLFWLELLHIYDKNTYNILAKNPERLLYEENKRFHLRDNIPSNITEYSKELLNKLFKEEDSEYKIRILHDNNREHTNRIRMIDNYDYYFTINKPKMELTEEELDYHLNYSLNKNIAMFTRIEHIEEIIQIWLYQDKKNFDSIINQFDKVDITKTHLDYIRNYIYSLLTLGLNIVSAELVNDVKFSKILKLLKEERYNSTLKTTINDFVKEYFNHKIEYVPSTEKNSKETENLLTNLSKLLNRVHRKSILKEDSNIGNISIIIDGNLIENQLKDVISKYLKYKEPHIHPNNITSIDLMNPNTNLGKIFFNCFLDDKENDKQIAFSTVIEHFAHRSPERPSLLDYNNAIQELNRLSYFNSRPNNLYKAHYNMWDFLEKEQANDIERFKEQCFTHN